MDVPLFSREDCGTPVRRDELTLVADPMTVEQRLVPFAWQGEDGLVRVLEWSASPMLDQAGMVVACFWDGGRTWTAAVGEVPPYPGGAATFGSLADAQRAYECQHRPLGW
jgi:hypothetical protein